MASFQKYFVTTNTTTTQACIEIIAGTIPFFLRQIDVTLTSAVASVLTIGKPAAMGITPTAPSPIPSIDGPGTSFSQATRALAWATSPTQPTNGVDHFVFPATIGSFKSLAWEPKAFRILPGQSLVLFNVGVVGTFNVTVRIDE